MVKATWTIWVQMFAKDIFCIFALMLKSFNNNLVNLLIDICDIQTIFKQIKLIMLESMKQLYILFIYGLFYC
jgi:hypothetical protein